MSLADAMEERRYDKDERIIIQGEVGDYFYIIRDGEAAVIQTSETGQQKKLNHLFKSDYFGEMALLREEPRMATVVALTTLKVVRINRETFRVRPQALEWGGRPPRAPADQCRPPFLSPATARRRSWARWRS